MEILIYEDNQNDLDSLLKCIKNFFSMTDLAYNIQVCTNSEYVCEYHFKYDLIFLDIEVYEKSGIDVGYEVRKHNQDVRLIFVSSFSKYLIDGYKAQANRYFVKPIQQEDFDIELKNVISDYLDEYDGFFDKTISLKKIYFKKIIYIEFINRKTKIHFLSGKVITADYSLKYWYQKLKNNGFEQSYKSLIINLRHVSGFTKNEVILDNEEVLPISRLFRREFESKFVESLHNRK